VELDAMRHSCAIAFVVGALLFAHRGPAKAAESGVGDYLLGSRGVGAGITPPPSVYFQDDTYFYSGKIGGGRTFPTGGLLVANVSAQSWINLPTTLWITPAKILGGDLGFSLTTPFGEPRVNASHLVNSVRFDVQNRPEGTAGYFTVSLPIGLDTNAQIEAGKAIKAKF
jgi:hypothetical protein